MSKRLSWSTFCLSRPIETEGLSSRLELFFYCLESVFYQGEFVEYFFEDSSEFFFSWSDVLSRSQRCGQRPYGSGSQGVWEI